MDGKHTIIIISAYLFVFWIIIPLWLVFGVVFNENERAKNRKELEKKACVDSYVDGWYLENGKFYHK